MSEQFFCSSGLAADFAARARLGIYVHVPFCPHICPYCDFVKTSRFTRADVLAYFSGLEAQCEQFLALIPNHIHTVTLYFGGGTPSLFPPEMYRPIVEKLRSRFAIEEFTVETNPFSNTEKVFEKWSDLGVNRITLGAQSLMPDVLHYLGRKHSPEAVVSNIQLARKAGIDNVQVDVIFGVKKLAAERNIESEIRALASAGATGVSCYLLTIEGSTSFSSENTSDDETICDEYHLICKTCDSLGFIQHETSNFGNKPSIHNRLYWYGLPYLGLGTGAHGLMPPSTEFPLGQRFKVGELLRRDEPGDDLLNFGSNCADLFKVEAGEEERTRDHVLQEMLFTLLRTSAGLPKKWLSQVYSTELLNKLSKDPRWLRACGEGAVIETQTHFKLEQSEKLRGDSWSLLLASILHPEGMS